MYRSLYAAFDVFPSSKGAATHISKMSKRLFENFDGGILHTLGSPLSPTSEIEGNIKAIRFNKQIPNFLARTQEYALHLHEVLENNTKLELVHFRDIWSGIPILNKKNKSYKTIFEVNGLPSIELPYRYPNLSKELINKIKRIEERCLFEADHIIVPSEVIRRNLIQNNNVPSSKISKITNGAYASPNLLEVEKINSPYLIYFGAPQSWQGIATLLKAFAKLEDFQDLKLLICCSTKERDTKVLRRITRRLFIEDKVIWKYRLSKGELNSYIKKALISVAPLKDCSRNVDQGCSPLKVFESMANKTAVIASDLEVCREIIQNNNNGILVRPDRPEILARNIRRLLEIESERNRLALEGWKTIQEKYNWDKILIQLDNVYHNTINNKQCAVK